MFVSFFGPLSDIIFFVKSHQAVKYFPEVITGSLSSKPILPTRLIRLVEDTWGKFDTSSCLLWHRSVLLRLYFTFIHSPSSQSCSTLPTFPRLHTVGSSTNENICSSLLFWVFLLHFDSQGSWMQTALEAQWCRRSKNQVLVFKIRPPIYTRKLFSKTT